MSSCHNCLNRVRGGFERDPALGERSATPADQVASDALPALAKDYNGTWRPGTRGELAARLDQLEPGGQAAVLSWPDGAEVAHLSYAERPKELSADGTPKPVEHVDYGLDGTRRVSTELPPDARAVMIRDRPLADAAPFDHPRWVGAHAQALRPRADEEPRRVAPVDPARAAEHGAVDGARGDSAAARPGAPRGVVGDAGERSKSIAADAEELFQAELRTSDQAGVRERLAAAKRPDSPHDPIVQGLALAKRQIELGTTKPAFVGGGIWAKSLRFSQLRTAAVINLRHFAKLPMSGGKSLAIQAAALADHIGHARAGRGGGVVVLTHTADLARRDARKAKQNLGPGGVEVTHVHADMTAAQKRAAYQGDVVYAHYVEYGHDLVRDRNGPAGSRAIGDREQSLIVDEVDLIALHRMTERLALSEDVPGPLPFKDDLDWARTMAPQLRGNTGEGKPHVDVVPGRAAWVNEEGKAFVKQIRDGRGRDLNDPENAQLLYVLNRVLTAERSFEEGSQYRVERDGRGDGTIHPLDASDTVRDGSRFNPVLDSALRLKHDLPPGPDTRTIDHTTPGRILDDHEWGGTSGTGSAAEFAGRYGKDTVEIPAEKTSRLRIRPPKRFGTSEERAAWAVDRAVRAAARGRPMQIWGADQPALEAAARHLPEQLPEGVRVQMLHSGTPDAEVAAFDANAGRPGMISFISPRGTRGFNYRPGGDAEVLTQLELVERGIKDPNSAEARQVRDEITDQVARDRETVLRLGGISQFRLGRRGHPSDDAQEQLRVGRDGDPGETRDLLADDDALLVNQTPVTYEARNTRTETGGEITEARGDATLHELGQQVSVARQVAANEAGLSELADPRFERSVTAAGEPAGVVAVHAPHAGLFDLPSLAAARMGQNIPGLSDEQNQQLQQDVTQYQVEHPQTTPEGQAAAARVQALIPHQDLVVATPTRAETARNLSTAKRELDAEIAAQRELKRMLRGIGHSTELAERLGYDPAELDRTLVVASQLAAGVGTGEDDQREPLKVERLTPRQRTILLRYADGDTTTDIAGQLDLDPHQVEQQLAAAIDTLGGHTDIPSEFDVRFQLAMRHGASNWQHIRDGLRDAEDSLPAAVRAVWNRADRIEELPDLRDTAYRELIAAGITSISRLAALTDRERAAAGLSEPTIAAITRALGSYEVPLPPEGPFGGRFTTHYRNGLVHLIDELGGMVPEGFESVALLSVTTSEGRPVTGSGIAVHYDGTRYYILTARHVFDNASEVAARVAGRPVTVLGVQGHSDPNVDLAVVIVQAEEIDSHLGRPLRLAVLGHSAVEPGTPLLVLGHPSHGLSPDGVDHLPGSKQKPLYVTAGHADHPDPTRPGQIGVAGAPGVAPGFSGGGTVSWPTHAGGPLVLHGVTATFPADGDPERLFHATPVARAVELLQSIGIHIELTPEPAAPNAAAISATLGAHPLIADWLRQHGLSIRPASDPAAPGQPTGPNAAVVSGGVGGGSGGTDNQPGDRAGDGKASDNKLSGTATGGHSSLKYPHGFTTSGIPPPGEPVEPNTRTTGLRGTEPTERLGVLAAGTGRHHHGAPRARGVVGRAAAAVAALAAAAVMALPGAAAAQAGVTADRPALAAHSVSAPRLVAPGPPVAPGPVVPVYEPARFALEHAVSLQRLRAANPEAIADAPTYRWTAPPGTPIRVPAPDPNLWLMAPDTNPATRHAANPWRMAEALLHQRGVSAPSDTQIQAAVGEILRANPAPGAGLTVRTLPGGYGFTDPAAPPVVHPKPPAPKPPAAKPPAPPVADRGGSGVWQALGWAVAGVYLGAATWLYLRPRFAVQRVIVELRMYFPIVSRFWGELVGFVASVLQPGPHLRLWTAEDRQARQSPDAQRARAAARAQRALRALSGRPWWSRWGAALARAGPAVWNWARTRWWETWLQLVVYNVPLVTIGKSTVFHDPSRPWLPKIQAKFLVEAPLGPLEDSLRRPGAPIRYSRFLWGTPVFPRATLSLTWGPIRVDLYTQPWTENGYPTTPRVPTPRLAGWHPLQRLRNWVLSHDAVLWTQHGLHFGTLWQLGIGFGPAMWDGNIIEFRVHPVQIQLYWRGSTHTLDPINGPSHALGRLAHAAAARLLPAAVYDTLAHTWSLVQPRADTRQLRHLTHARDRIRNANKTLSLQRILTTARLHQLNNTPRTVITRLDIDRQQRRHTRLTTAINANTQLIDDVNRRLNPNPDSPLRGQEPDTATGHHTPTSPASGGPPLTPPGGDAPLRGTTTGGHAASGGSPMAEGPVADRTLSGAAPSDDAILARLVGRTGGTPRARGPPPASGTSDPRLGGRAGQPRRASTALALALVAAIAAKRAGVAVPAPGWYPRPEPSASVAAPLTPGGAGEPGHSTASDAPRPLRDSTGLYPRVVRLAHSGAANGTLVAAVVGFDSRGGFGAIYRSLDGGRTFTEAGTVRDPDATKGLCCASLFELPTRIGQLPAGTLLWSASVAQDSRPMSLNIWKSTDQGVTWSMLSSPRVAADTGGLWEPELSVDAAGRLVMHYSDETHQPRHSQLLAETFSLDGLTWSPPTVTVASPNPAHRPGMAVVWRLADGRYAMTYELVGTGDQYDAAAHIRFSTDGWHWGDAGQPGTLITDSAGRYFAHAPTVTVAPDGKTLFVVGQQLRNADGGTSPDSGRVVFTNTHAGTGPWTAITAPAAVPAPAGVPGDHANYSSALLVLPDGTLLEIATAYDHGVAKPYHATGPGVVPSAPTRTPSNTHSTPTPPGDGDRAPQRDGSLDDQAVNPAVARPRQTELRPAPDPTSAGRAPDTPLHGRADEHSRDPILATLAQARALARLAHHSLATGQTDRAERQFRQVAELVLATPSGSARRGTDRMSREEWRELLRSALRDAEFDHRHMQMELPSAVPPEAGSAEAAYQGDRQSALSHNANLIASLEAAISGEVRADLPPVLLNVWGWDSLPEQIRKALSAAHRLMLAAGVGEALHAALGMVDVEILSDADFEARMGSDDIPADRWAAYAEGGVVIPERTVRRVDPTDPYTVARLAAILVHEMAHLADLGVPPGFQAERNAFWIHHLFSLAQYVRIAAEQRPTLNRRHMAEFWASVIDEWHPGDQAPANYPIPGIYHIWYRNPSDAGQNDTPLSGQEPPRSDDDVPTSVRRMASSVVKIARFDTLIPIVGTSTGFVVAPERVLAAAHAVMGLYQDIMVITSQSDDPLEAELVYFDPVHDVAVLHVPGLDAEPLRIASGPLSSRELRAWALGYPPKRGYAETPVMILPDSRQMRTGDARPWFDVHVALARTSSGIGPGTSGGAIVDAAENVLGMIAGGLGRTIVAAPHPVLAEAARAAADLTEPVAFPFAPIEHRLDRPLDTPLSGRHPDPFGSELGARDLQGWRELLALTFHLGAPGHRRNGTTLHVRAVDPGGGSGGADNQPGDRAGGGKAPDNELSGVETGGHSSHRYPHGFTTSGIPPPGEPVEPNTRDTGLHDSHSPDTPLRGDPSSDDAQLTAAEQRIADARHLIAQAGNLVGASRPDQATPLFERATGLLDQAQAQLASLAALGEPTAPADTAELTARRTRYARAQYQMIRARGDEDLPPDHGYYHYEDVERLVLDYLDKRGAGVVELSRLVEHYGIDSDLEHILGHAFDLSVGLGPGDTPVARLPGASETGFARTMIDFRRVLRLEGADVSEPLVVDPAYPIDRAGLGRAPYERLGQLWLGAGAPMLAIDHLRVYRVRHGDQIFVLALAGGELIHVLRDEHARTSDTPADPDTAWRQFTALLPPFPNLRTPEQTASRQHTADRAGITPARLGTPEAREMMATHPYLNWVLRPDGTVWIVPHTVEIPTDPDAEPTTAEIHHTVPAVGGPILDGGEAGIDIINASPTVTVLNVHTFYHDDNTDTQNRAAHAIGRAAFAIHDIPIADTWATRDNPLRGEEPAGQPTPHAKPGTASPQGPDTPRRGVAGRPVVPGVPLHPISETGRNGDVPLSGQEPEQPGALPVQVRPLRHDDPAVDIVFADLGDRSRRQFLDVGNTRLSPAVRRYLRAVDGRTHVGLVAEVGVQPDTWWPVGIVHLHVRPETNNVTLYVADHWQHRGIGRRLLYAMVELAADMGHTELTSLVLPGNRAMLALAEQLPGARRTVEGGYYRITVPITPTADTLPNDPDTPHGPGRDRPLTGPADAPRPGSWLGLLDTLTRWEPDRPVTAADLAGAGRSPDTTGRALDTLARWGLLRPDQPGQPGQPGRYRLPPWWPVVTASATAAGPPAALGLAHLLDTPHLSDPAQVAAARAGLARLATTAETLHPLTGLGQRILLDTPAGPPGQAAIWATLARALLTGTLAPARTETEHLFATAPQPLNRFRPHWIDDQSAVKSTCCRNYESPRHHHHYCATCPTTKRDTPLLGQATRTAAQPVNRRRHPLWALAGPGDWPPWLAVVGQTTDAPAPPPWVIEDATRPLLSAQEIIEAHPGPETIRQDSGTRFRQLGGSAPGKVGHGGTLALGTPADAAQLAVGEEPPGPHPWMRPLPGEDFPALPRGPPDSRPLTRSAPARSPGTARHRTSPDVPVQDHPAAVTATQPTPRRPRCGVAGPRCPAPTPRTRHRALRPPPPAARGPPHRSSPHPRQPTNTTNRGARDQ